MKQHIILFLAANPGGTDPRTLGREARAIQKELESAGFRDRFELVTRWAAQPLDLLRELRKLKPTVVHFSGHGSHHEAGEHRLDPAPRRDVGGGDSHHDGGRQQHGLHFESPDGRAQVVSADALGETFGAAGDSVRLVVLSACYSEPQAAALLAHVDCVVGMRGTVDDDAARSFAIGFYGGLGERVSVAAAYRQGCAAIRLEGSRDADHPRLEVRAGVDATRLVLAAEPPASCSVHVGEIAHPRGDLPRLSAVAGRGPRVSPSARSRWVAAFAGLGTVAVGSVVAVAVPHGGGSTPTSSERGVPASSLATPIGVGNRPLTAAAVTPPLAPAREQHDPSVGIVARAKDVLTRFVAWSHDHRGAPCPDIAALGDAPRDPWGSAFRLTCIDQPDHQIIGAISAGPDGTPGTPDDIASWWLGREVTDLVRGTRWGLAPRPARLEQGPRTDSHRKPAPPATKSVETSAAETTRLESGPPVATGRKQDGIEFDELGIPIQRVQPVTRE